MSSVCSVEAEQEIGAGLGTPAKLVRVAGIDADAQTFGLQPTNCVFQTGKRRTRLAAEIDHVRPLPAQLGGSRKQRVLRQQRRVHNFGENTDIIA